MGWFWTSEIVHVIMNMSLALSLTHWLHFLCTHTLGEELDVIGASMILHNRKCWVKFPLGSVWRFSSSTASLIHVFLITAILIGVRCYVFEARICISLRRSGTEQICLHLLAICVFALEKSLFRHYIHLFIYLFVEFLYILSINP